MRKIVGLVNAFFGFTHIVIGSRYALVELPNFFEYCKKLSVEVDNRLYIFPVLIIFFGIINITVGAANLELIFKFKGNQFVKIGSFLVFVSFALTSILINMFR